MTDRTANHSSSSHCRFCCDSGWLAALTRRDPVRRTVREEYVDAEGVTRFRTVVKVVGETEPIEEMAPCPACEIGYRREFGLGRRREKQGDREVLVEYENPDGGPWGKEGYWRGRPWDHLRPVCPGGWNVRRNEHSVPAPDEIERKHVRALLAQTSAGLAGGLVKDMEDMP